MISVAPPSRPHVFAPATTHPQSTPTLLLLHGTGADEHDLFPLGKKLNSSANLLSPRGLYIENGLNRFFERYPDGTFNENSIDEAVSDLARFLEESIAFYRIDPSQITVVGFSNGANTGSALLVSKPELLNGAILFGTTRPFRDRKISSDLSGKRIWIANGDQDPYANLNVSETWVSDLRAAGAEVSFLRHPGGHNISMAHVQQISSLLA